MVYIQYRIVSDVLFPRSPSVNLLPDHKDNMNKYNEFQDEKLEAAYMTYRMVCIIYLCIYHQGHDGPRMVVAFSLMMILFGVYAAMMILYGFPWSAANSIIISCCCYYSGRYIHTQLGTCVCVYVTAEYNIRSVDKHGAIITVALFALASVNIVFSVPLVARYVYCVLHYC